jgi:hypothetical protein
MWRILRTLVLLVLFGAIFTGLAYLITSYDRSQAEKDYQLRITAAVQTAIAGALFDATRTAEADLPQYRLIVIHPDQSLTDLAAQYRTTAQIIRIVNGLRDDVEYGNGESLIIPEGVTQLEPPRRFRLHTATASDTLFALAKFYDVPLDLLQQDNPVLTNRGIIPGDIVFIPILLSSM